MEIYLSDTVRSSTRKELLSSPEIMVRFSIRQRIDFKLNKPPSRLMKPMV